MTAETRASQPRFDHHHREIQPFGTLNRYPIALGENARSTSVTALNQILADTMALRDLYKKHHWQTAGPTFYQLHLLFDKHAGEQSALIDAIAERIMSLGGVSIAMAHDVAEMTRVERPPKGREALPAQLTRLLDAHQTVLEFTRKAAREATENGDDGTNDLLVSQVVRTNEMQVWFLSEHLVETPLTGAG